ADFLAKIYHVNLHNIWLCHLSRDNNHPELAFKTIDIRLFREGIRVGKDVNIITLKRTHPSDVYFFE
ncbi:MAG: MBL fold metallo-hydrolase, partial [Tannerellaceae bacterium]